MRIEGAFLVRNAYQDDLGLWSVEGIVEDFEVPRVPSKLRGLLYFAKLALTEEEMNGGVPVYSLAWLGPSKQSTHAAAASTLRCIAVKPFGGGTSVIRHALELRVQEEGAHKLVLFVNGCPKHWATVHVHRKS